MKVLFVNHAAGLGGAEHSLLELLAYLPAFGIEPVAAVPAGSLAEVLAAAGVRVGPLALRPLPRPHTAVQGCAAAAALAWNALLLLRCLRRERPALVHANSARAAWPAALAARLAGVPCLWHCRDLSPPGAEALLRLCSRGIAISEAVARSLPASPRVRIIRNGIDLLRFDPARHSRAEARAALRLPSEGPLVIMVADLIPWKRHDLFLEAAARIRRARPDVRFAIAGHDRGEHPDLAGRLRVQTARLGLTGALQWLGHCPDAAPLYAAADVLLHPPAEEPFGRVVCEALAMGCGVVVADAAGPAAIVGACPAGRRVLPGSAAAFAAAALELLDRPFPADAGRAHVARGFDVARTASELARLLRELRPDHPWFPSAPKESHASDAS